MKGTDKELELKIILRCEAEEAKWGAEASKARNEYASKYAEYNRGDRVKMLLHNGSERYGIIDRVSFSTHWGMQYMIRPKGKNWSNKTNRRAFYFYNTRGKNKEVKDIVVVDL